MLLPGVSKELIYHTLFYEDRNWSGNGLFVVIHDHDYDDEMMVVRLVVPK